MLVEEHAGRSVLYRSEYNPYFRTNSRLFPATEFLVDVLQHLPEVGTRLIRRYGLYSWRSRGIWSRTPHLARLAPEGWKKDQEPQPFEVYSHCLTPFPARQCFPHGLQSLPSDLP